MNRYVYRLRAISYLFEAEDESQEWPELYNSIREARKAYQQNGTIPDFAAMAPQVAEARSASNVTS